MLKTKSIKRILLNLLPLKIVVNVMSSEIFIVYGTFNKAERLIKKIIAADNEKTYWFSVYDISLYKIDHLHNCNKKFKDFYSPFRVGRKQSRAILDANGKTVVVFDKGLEDIAKITCDLYNKD